PNYQQCVYIGGAGGSNPCKRGFGSLHTGVIQFAMADGSVQAFSQNIDMGVEAASNDVDPPSLGVLPALASRSGGEVANLPGS
ncbi:MAG: DUF1559 domain-containing protein, partial [Planctomycetales bacterium]|nr:DUF1559 domain-containing protein [Planctomycetales bacterium]